MGLPALGPAPQCHFCLLEEQGAPGVLPLGAPKAAHTPLPPKGCLALQLAGASQLPQDHPPGRSGVTQTVLGTHRVG